MILKLNDNNNPGWTIVIQEKGCLGFLRHVLDVQEIVSEA